MAEEKKAKELVMKQMQEDRQMYNEQRGTKVGGSEPTADQQEKLARWKEIEED